MPEIHVTVHEGKMKVGAVQAFTPQWPDSTRNVNFLDVLKQVSKRVSPPASTGSQTSASRRSGGYTGKRKRPGKIEGVEG